MLLAYARFLGFQYFCAGCGGEEVRRFAAFPPHPLRTRFSKEQLKQSGGVAIITFSNETFQDASGNPKEPLNQSAAALNGSFAPTDRFENLEIRKGFLQAPNLNLEQNPSLAALAIESELP